MINNWKNKVFNFKICNVIFYFLKIDDNVVLVGMIRNVLMIWYKELKNRKIVNILRKFILYDDFIFIN